MTNVIFYFLQVNICLLILGVLYYTLLKNETDFRFRRAYIIGSVILSAILPLFDLSYFTISTQQLSEGIATTILPEFNVGSTINNTASSVEEIDHYRYLGYAYLGIALLIMQYFIFQIGQVMWFTFSSKNKTRYEDGYVLIKTNGTLPTFSFFNLLFFDNSIDLSPEDKLKILNHEKAHIKQLHSFDILILEICKIVNWVNPMAWYFRKEIQEIHEYLADEKVVKKTGAQQYSSLLAKMALNQAHLAIGHHFNKSKIIKRIEMMKTAKRKIKNWKLVAIMPAIVIALVVVACSDEVARDIDEVMLTASQTEIPADQEQKMLEYQEKYPEANFVYIEADASSKESMRKLKDLDPNSIAHINVDKERDVIGAIVNQNGALKGQNKGKEGFYTVVDEPAMPNGGYEAFYQRLAANLTYPEQAKKAGVEGKVYVQFVVDKDGTLTEMEVVKGLGAGCDLAALAAVGKEGKWSSPKQNGVAVTQRIILPISFSLEKKSKNG